MLTASKLKELLDKAKSDLAQVHALSDFEKLQTHYLGRKSFLNQSLKELASLTIEERRTVGSLANQIKEELGQLFAAKEEELFRTSQAAETDSNLDLTLPGAPHEFGGSHPLTITARKVLEVFKKLGFVYVEAPEIETDLNNFTYLNVPEDHPARDMWDTLYLKGQEGQSGQRGQQGSKEKETKWLLRTHATPVQMHVMKEVPPPYRVVTCGKVFRREAIDATHLPVFHQIDAFYVDKSVTFLDLKSTLETWAAQMFGNDATIRFKPSYFPFTEPSCEVEIKCFLCKGQICGVCKNGWLEMLGAGMIHPKVLEMQGRDPNVWRGFAFGLGLERVAMVAWGIPDIRLFYENDLDFLRQFKSVMI